MRRLGFALLVLPVLLLALLAFALRVLERAPEPFTYNELAGPGIAFILLTYAVMGLVSVPLLILSLWRRWLSLWHMLLVGAITGLFAVVLPVWPLLLDEKLHLHYRLDRVLDGYPFLLFGSLAGALFWLLAIFRNPSFRQSQPAQSAA